MSDQVENTPSSEDGQVNLGIAEQWDAVLATAPAMARLPDMVVGQYKGTDMPKDMLEELHVHVKHGVILLHQLIGDKINKLFEHFDVHFGVGCEMLMEDVESTYESNDEITRKAEAEGTEVSEDDVQTYTPAEICGRLFAYIAMEVYTRQWCDDLDDGSSIDEVTGFVKNMDAMVIKALIDRIVMCAELGPNDSKKVLLEAYPVAYGYILHLCEPTKTTVRH